MTRAISTPDLPTLLLPLLGALPPAAASPTPPPGLLPLFTPILRQRVQVLSSADSSESWLPLLSHSNSDAKALELTKIVTNDVFEPHPISGEVEVDWEYDVDVRYKRLDEETLEALVGMKAFSIAIRLLWCVGDVEGGGDGWRVAEVKAMVSITDDAQWAAKSISVAESSYRAQHATADVRRNKSFTNGFTLPPLEHARMNGASVPEDDDAYWAQYDQTPSQTPGPGGPSPAPGRGGRPGVVNGHTERFAHNDEDEEDSYYAQYSSVQPALDDHDPDEALENGHVETTLGSNTNGAHNDDAVAIDHSPRQAVDTHSELTSSHSAWTLSRNGESDSHYAHTTNGHAAPAKAYDEDEAERDLVQPRPASSNGSVTDEVVTKLERRASMQGQSEVAVRQHISTSIKSLYRLARVAGFERDEFERLVKLELDCLGMMDED